MKSQTSSAWSMDDPVRKGSALAADESCDVCVVGAGIAGLTTAYLLLREQKRVIVLDAKPQVAGGETEFTTAHLAWYVDDHFKNLASVRGDEVAKAAAASHRDAIHIIRENIERENIDCDFEGVPAYLFPGIKHVSVTMEDEEKALRRLGIPCEHIEKVPYLTGCGGPCLKFADHAQFHPLKYLTGLTRAILRLGGKIHTETQVVDVESGDTCRVKTRQGSTVSANAVVICANSPFAVGTLMHTKVAAYTTYAIAGQIEKGSLPHALYWDTEDPYHYIRTAPMKDKGTELLIVGGEDHKTGQASDQIDRWNELEAWARERFPQLGAVEHCWSGEVFETPDGLGLIGLAPGGRKNTYIITGDSGMGMTHSTLGARLIADLIASRVNSLASIYSPSRWMPGALRSLLGESMNAAAQYSDWLTGSEVATVEQIPAGQGAIMRHGLTKIAVYREDDNTVHKLSAVCTHMGGIVHWNPGEKSWDCPCHGSRFTCDGKVLHGPAIGDLKKAE